MNFKQIFTTVRYSKPVNFGRNVFKKITLPGLEGMSLYEGVKFTIEAFLRSDIATPLAGAEVKVNVLPETVNAVVATLSK